MSAEQQRLSAALCRPTVCTLFGYAGNAETHESGRRPGCVKIPAKGLINGRFAGNTGFNVQLEMEILRIVELTAGLSVLTMRFKFQPSHDGVDQVLGELESQVMSLVWENPGATARELYDKLSKPNLAYTTIVTILDRLHLKGLVTRRKIGRPFAYTASVAREDFEAQLTRDVLAGLLKEDSRPVLNTFVDLVSASPDLLDELERLIQERKA